MTAALADGLIGALVALEFDHQKPALRLVNRQKCRSARHRSGIRYRLGIVARAENNPFLGERRSLPVLQQEFFELTFEGEAPAALE